MISRELRVLFRKEWRQLVASRSAIATAALMPVLFLGVIPQFLAWAASQPQHHTRPPGPSAFGLIAEVGNDIRTLPGALLPVFVALVGLILPTMMASALLITERERRTLELLVALPVRMEQVLGAKLLATLAASSMLTVPLLVFDIVSFLVRGVATPEQVVLLPVVLVAALGLSSSNALLMALLSKDFRTANNVAGVMLVPAFFLTMLLEMLLPGGPVRALGLATLYGVTAVLVARRALKTSTFEKLLS